MNPEIIPSPRSNPVCMHSTHSSFCNDQCPRKSSGKGRAFTYAADAVFAVVLPRFPNKVKAERGRALLPRVLRCTCILRPSETLPTAVDVCKASTQCVGITLNEEGTHSEHSKPHTSGFACLTIASQPRTHMRKRLEQLHEYVDKFMDMP